MCGIVGIISKEDVAPRLLEGLKRLEYRGYDSAGVATLNQNSITTCRAEGKLVNLEEALEKKPLSGTIGIGHTRWATHGIPNTTNAHPHSTNKVSVVHNGIIENFKTLREELEATGDSFTTETDTEVIPHLITHYLKQGDSPHDAAAKAFSRLEGAFAVAVLFADNDNLLIAARRGSPLAIGYGEGEMFIASDAYALAPLTSKVSYMEDGDWAEVTHHGATVYNDNNEEVKREVKISAVSDAMIGKDNYRHYMLKEIFEQPTVIGDTLNAYHNAITDEIRLPDMPFSLEEISRISIIACGTSYYAGLTAKYWLESIANVPVDIDIASEFRYRTVTLQEKGLVICISQSGETADTLAALRYAKEQGQYVACLVNTEESTISRESDVTLRTLAGPEIGVASTKAYTTQLVTLACFTLAMAEAKGSIDAKQKERLGNALAEVPARAADILNHDEALLALAHQLESARSVLYIGRGTSYAVALEGALKLKELSYIHAEGVAAGELKHGPIALIDADVPVIVIAPYDDLFEKTASNVQEVAAREGHVIFLSDHQGVEKLRSVTREVIELPTVDPFVAPILYAIPVQLLAYHTAVLKGTDVDQPRNLAKSVTVE